MFLQALDNVQHNLADHNVLDHRSKFNHVLHEILVQVESKSTSWIFSSRNDCSFIVDGQWATWTNWTACSSGSCAAGSSSRYRTCNNPPPSNGFVHRWNSLGLIWQSMCLVVNFVLVIQSRREYVLVLQLVQSMVIGLNGKLGVHVHRHVSVVGVYAIVTVRIRRRRTVVYHVSVQVLISMVHVWLDLVVCTDSYHCI